MADLDVPDGALDESDLPTIGRAPGSELTDRITDLLRPSSAGAVRARSVDDPREASRAIVRAIAIPYLVHASAEVDREIVARLERGEAIHGRLENALALAERPPDRTDLCKRWRAQQDDVAELRAKRSEIRDEAARAAGADDAVAWVASTCAVEPLAVLDQFERGAFRPLDEEVARAARVRSLVIAGVTPDGGDDAAIRVLSEHDRMLPAAAIPPLLRRIGARLRFDPDSGTGPTLRVVDPVDRPLAGVFPWCRGRPHVAVPAHRGGPGGVRDALAAFGRGCRFAVVRRLRGDAAALGADPAFDTAAEVLFRRLVLSGAFVEWAGIAGRESWAAAARLEDAVEPRVDGATIEVAHVPIERLTVASREAISRAVGRPPSPGRETRAWTRDPASANRLRGTVLGLLIEERLLLRYGHLWFADRLAGRWLHEVWEAEPGETAESMAGSMSVGRIEPTPVFDRCRP